MENQQPTHQDDPPTQYPTGRGYGHDYMRGGEVFGGYGYSERDEYARSLDESAGDGESMAPEEERTNEAHQPRAHDSGGTALGSEDRDAPVPQLEHTFGLHAVGGHSRSFYVTQAQLQQRIYRPRREAENGEGENPSPS